MSKRQDVFPISQGQKELILLLQITMTWQSFTKYSYMTKQTPEFTFPEEATGSDSEFLFRANHEFPRYIGPHFAPESPTVVRVQITDFYVLLIDEEDDVIVEADVIFDEEIIVCENDQMKCFLRPRNTQQQVTSRSRSSSSRSSSRSNSRSSS